MTVLETLTEEIEFGHSSEQLSWASPPLEEISAYYVEFFFLGKGLENVYLPNKIWLNLTMMWPSDLNNLFL